MSEINPNECRICRMILDGPASYHGNGPTFLDEEITINEHADLPMCRTHHALYDAHVANEVPDPLRKLYFPEWDHDAERKANEPTERVATTLKCTVCADVEAGHYRKHAPDMETYPDAPLTTTKYAPNPVCQPHADFLQALAFRGKKTAEGFVLGDPNLVLDPKKPKD